MPLKDAEIDRRAAVLLAALDRIHPIPDIQAGPGALGRWLMECGNNGLIGDDTVVWLHRLLLPNVKAAQEHAPPPRRPPRDATAVSSRGTLLRRRD